MNTYLLTVPRCQRLLFLLITTMLSFLFIGCGGDSIRKVTVTPGKWPPPRPVQPDSPSPPVVPSPPPVTSPRPSLDSYTVVIDPGHGGKDPGARGLSREPEKNIVLKIARQVARKLKQRGVNVVMTRNSDRFISLDARATLAEQRHAHLFVSIHADATRKRTVYGATVLMGRTASFQSKRAAWLIRKSLESHDVFCRKSRQQQLRVLENHSRPAVLIECGFLTNRTDARNLNSSWYQSEIAAAIAQGIETFLTRS